MRQESGFNSPSHESYEQQVDHTERAKNLGGIAINNPDTGPMAMYGPMPSSQPTAEKQREAAEAQRVETLKTLDKDAFKLGDLNPLIHPPDLGRKESIDAVCYTITEKIKQYGGVQPEILESTVVSDGKNVDLRFIARFEVPSLSEEQIEMLEHIVGETYDLTVRTRTDNKGGDLPTEVYPPTQPTDEVQPQTAGWYMGPAPSPTNPLHQGLYVFQDFGKVTTKNFSQSLEQRGKSVKYIVEVREAGKEQMDLVTFVTQISSVLAKNEIPDRGQLLYETYYDLIRLGLKKFEEGSIYGMENAQDMITRELILPLASPELSQGIGEDPQSVLMVGVPGTGKTLVAEWLLQKDTGLFILPIDPFALQKELAQPKEKQRLLPRIAKIARVTGKDIILHVDDIENMVGSNEVTNSTMLNLMAGVQESGFYIIASTNYPEKINPSLIQPQRFSVLIHCGLQDEAARYEILKIHANKASKKLGKELFDSDEIRDDILREVAKHTKNFTPRYLSNIATVAKSFLVSRVAKEKGKILELTEADLDGHTFQVEDWERAFAEVSSKYDSDAVEKYDERLSRFVKKHSRAQIGFGSYMGGAAIKRIFSDAVHEKVAAAKATPEDKKSK